MSEDAPTVLLVAPATSYRIEAFVRAAARIGVTMVIATDVPAASGSFGLPVHRVSFTDAEASLAALGAVRFDGVVAVDERSAWLAARFAEAGVVRGAFHSASGVLAARDKRKMRAALLAAGVSVPRFAVLAAGAQVHALGVELPGVVKPSMLSGSQWVIRANDATELDHAAARTRAILARHDSPLCAEPGFFELLLESYVDGEEVAVEGLMRAGELELLAVFDKPDPLCGPYFEETLYIAPSRKSREVVASVVATAVAAARALGLCDGPIHAELRVGERGPVLIEIAARSIGGLCSRALSHLVGSLEERLLRGAAGLPLEPLRREPPAIGVMMIPVPRSGVLCAVSGVEEACRVPGVDAVTMTVAVGESVRTLPEGNSYFGFVFAHASEPGAVEQALREAHAALRFSLTPLLPLVN